MKQYLIQYLNIVVGVLATVLDVNRYFWIDRINYIYESITQKQLFITFPHAGRGAPKTLTVFTYSVEYPTVALKGSMHRKKKMDLQNTKGKSSQRLHQFDNTTNYRNRLQIPPRKNTIPELCPEDSQRCWTHQACSGSDALWLMVPFKSAIRQWLLGNEL